MFPSSMLQRRCAVWPRGLLLSALVMLLSFTGSVWAEAAVAEAPALPKDIEPLPAALAGQMKDLQRAAEKYRGLKFKHDVPCGALGEVVLKKKMVESFQEELPPLKMRPLEITLKSFGFIPEDMDLGKYFPELLTSQVGGFYDPKRQYLVIVQRQGGLLGPELKKQYGAEIADRMEQTVLVHELTHAVQDQHFNLQKLAATDPLSDECTARVALVEGDATLTMYNFFAKMNLESLPGVEQMIKQLLKDPKQLLDMSPDLPGSKEMAAAPAWFRDTLLFSYMEGYVFCLNVKKAGGQKLLDYAFTKDPPRSSEQILHPEKWYLRRDDPVAITWPDMAAQLPGYTKAGEGQLGEAGIKCLLRDKLKDQDRATVAAAGWGGDRCALYEKDGRRLLLWVTEWDTEQDCREFAAAARALGPDWQVDQCAPKRADVMRGKLTDAETAAVRGALAAAKAQFPENKSIDLTELGIEKPKAGDNIDVGGLIEQLLAGNDKKNEGGLDLGALLNNPQAQEMIKGMLNQERPAGEASADGKTYTNATLGFSIKAPESQKEWKLDPKPPIPMASVLISSPDGTVQINVINQTMPMAVPIEMMGMAVEMGPQMMFQDYKKISGGVVTKGDNKAYELQYEGTQDRQKLRATQRVFIQGAEMIVVSAVAPAEKWNDNEKAINETLDSFKLNQPAKKTEGVKQE